MPWMDATTATRVTRNPPQRPIPDSVIDTATAKSEPRLQVEGVVRSVTFHNQENGYTVFQLQSGVYESTIIGTTAGVSPGESARCIGTWQQSAQYGRQFKAESVHLAEPTTREALLRYLGSGVIPGIGEHFAQTLVDHFGLRVFDVLDQEPEKIAALPGIGKKRREAILASRLNQKEMRETMVFLMAHGLGGARAAKAYKQYGAKTIEWLSENPYRMARELHGFGFQVADEFAKRLGIAATEPARLSAGLVHTLEVQARSGHCALTEPQLLKTAAELLAVPGELLPSVLRSEVSGGRLATEVWKEVPHYYLPQLQQAERAVAAQMMRLLRGPLPWQSLLTRSAVAPAGGVQLSEKQQDALEAMLQTKVAVMTGGPGVGKTTLTRNLLDRVCQGSLRVLLCAPTGKAAKRLSESTGREARTIHRLLEFNPMGGFARNSRDPLEADLIVVDEASMIDIELMAALVDAIGPGAGLWLVGDADQLPSVGPGAVLHDLIASARIPVIRLTEIFRQAASSRIIVNAHRILRGEIPPKQEPGDVTDFYLFTEENSDAIASRLVDIVARKIPAKFGFDPLRDVQVLTPMRRGPLGAEALANALQGVLNPHPAGAPGKASGARALTYGSTTYALGDKVMQVVNNYEKSVFNGESGFVVQVEPEDRLLTVDFDGRQILYHVTELDELVLAYALSIHKSQGSEYPVVVIPMTTQHYTLLERNLLYTGVTRGKQLVVLIGQPRALAVAVRTHRAGLRHTTLVERLRAA
ncbi:SF1B family DNA helicase RecD2 [Thiomonas sp.]